MLCTREIQLVQCCYCLLFVGGYGVGPDFMNRTAETRGKQQLASIVKQNLKLVSLLRYPDIVVQYIA
ncbi:hypothetical protein MTR_4g113190 [Medicago truncatula]|uniref:Uncharacterized protein n=1 Tax=Medicago truncatula TaxID=3880 RepID=G7JU68_MEDTR|nr:hypothetical protein MTR_4g113190 [Medicago truncatula]